VQKGQKSGFSPDTGDTSPNMTEETRKKVIKRITRMMYALDADGLKLIYHLTASALRNQTRQAEQKGG
jgi:hypothetical protein